MHPWSIWQRLNPDQQFVAFLINRWVLVDINTLWFPSWSSGVGTFCSCPTVRSWSQAGQVTSESCDLATADEDLGGGMDDVEEIHDLWRWFPSWCWRCRGDPRSWMSRRSMILAAVWTMSRRSQALWFPSWCCSSSVPSPGTCCPPRSAVWPEGCCRHRIEDPDQRSQ